MLILAIILSIAGVDQQYEICHTHLQEGPKRGPRKLLMHQADFNSCESTEMGPPITTTNQKKQIIEKKMEGICQIQIKPD